MRNLIAVSLLMVTALFAQDQAQVPGNPPPQQLQNQQQAAPPPAPTQPAIARTNLVENFNGPTMAEIDCAGFMTKNAVHPAGTVVGGYGAPELVNYSNQDYIYLTGDVQVGQEYQLVRATTDPNKYESFPGQLATLRSLGDLYQDLGRAKVLYIRKKIGIAQIERSCSSTLPGDIAVPFQERPRPEFKQTNFELFPESNGKTKGRIVMGRDLDTMIGMRRIVYLNVGETQGVKPGDYFLVTRNYSAVTNDPVESLGFEAPMYDDTQKDPLKFDYRTHAGEFPTRSIGEVMVISTSSNSSTALTTFVAEDIHLGDDVEMIDSTPMAAPAAAAAPPPQPPTISCSVNRSSIQVSETANITCNGTAEEGHNLSYNYQASAGQIAPHDNRATLTATAAGPVTVTATAVDDRNLSAQTSVNVNVEAVSTPATPTTLNELTFSPNSARVDNRAKAVLDDDALRLQRDATASLILEGSTNPSETDNLAGLRANNAKDYLTRSKGIDANRIQTRPAQAKTGAKVTVILMPAGAPPQQ